MTNKIFPDLDPTSYQRHALHAQDRDWPETNCYLDVWIEVLPALGYAPEACLGYSITQDFEGDQFTFFKVPLEDLERLYGLRVTELAIYDRVETHVAEQIARGRLSLVEVDSYYLPDTHGIGYRQAHGKTTVAINRIDFEQRSMDYFHGLGLHRLEGEDFDGIFWRNAPEGALPFLPYTEFVKFPEVRRTEDHVRATALFLLKQHLERRPASNPVKAFAEVFPAQVEAVAERPFEYFHLYAFNTLRQMGANYELFAAHLDWLSGNQIDGLAEASAQARKISTTSKAVQFQLARAVMRKKFDKLVPALQPCVDAWDAMVESLDKNIAISSALAA
ncbi:DUF1839 family protein [Roseibium denhamense]|nr:DUF1839 family protein [Roseibium denhamense]MTI05556.1 DUF1839 family protein [Roseibium denhamense]